MRKQEFFESIQRSITPQDACDSLTHEASATIFAVVLSSHVCETKAKETVGFVHVSGGYSGWATFSH